MMGMVWSGISSRRTSIDDRRMGHGPAAVRRRLDCFDLGELPRGMPAYLSSVTSFSAVHDLDRKAAGVATTPARMGASARASKIERDGTLLNGGSIAKLHR